MIITYWHLLSAVRLESDNSYSISDADKKWQLLCKNISLNEMFAYNDKSRNIVWKEDIVNEENEKILKEENIKRILKMISKSYSKE